MPKCEICSREFKPISRLVKNCDECNKVIAKALSERTTIETEKEEILDTLRRTKMKTEIYDKLIERWEALHNLVLGEKDFENAAKCLVHIENLTKEKYADSKTE